MTSNMKITDNTTETFKYRDNIVEIKWLCGAAVYDCPSLELFSFSSERGIIIAIGRKLGPKGAV